MYCITTYICIEIQWVLYEFYLNKVSWVHNEINAQLIIFKYKKNTMKRKEKLYTEVRR